jgi:hypothetical protein
MHRLLYDEPLRKTYRSQQHQRVRNRRCATDPAKRRWYALWRAVRFAKLQPLLDHLIETGDLQKIIGGGLDDRR